MRKLSAGILAIMMILSFCSFAVADETPITVTVFRSDPGDQSTDDNKICMLIEEEFGFKFEIEFLADDLAETLGTTSRYVLRKFITMLMVLTMYVNAGLIPNYLLISKALHLSNPSVCTSSPRWSPASTRSSSAPTSADCPRRWRFSRLLADHLPAVRLPSCPHCRSWWCIPSSSATSSPAWCWAALRADAFSPAATTMIEEAESR